MESNRLTIRLDNDLTTVIDKEIAKLNGRKDRIWWKRPDNRSTVVRKILRDHFKLDK